MLTMTSTGPLRGRCLQGGLRRVLARVGRAVANKPLLPALGAIRLAPGDGRLALAATNLEFAITTGVSAVVEGGDALAVPARLLTDFVGSLPDGEVRLEVDPAAQALRLAGGRARATIKGFDADDFPLVPVLDGPPLLCIDAGRLREAIGRVAFAVSADDSRPTLAGIHCRVDGACLTLAAADGFRLSVCEVALDAPARAAADVIAPVRALRELARLLDDPAEAVEVRLAANTVGFRAGDLDLVARLIDGAFPDYRRIIPTEHATRAVLDARELLGAVRRAAAFARDGEGAVRLTLTPGGDPAHPGGLTLAAEAAEVGDHTGELDADVEGEALEIAFDARYLAEALGAIAAGRVALEMAGPTQPGVLRPIGDDSFIHVLMPMHLARRSTAPDRSA
jgi:DNA polymerase-3 subunit beta